MSMRHPVLFVFLTLAAVMRLALPGATVGGDSGVAFALSCALLAGLWAMNSSRHHLVIGVFLSFPAALIGHIAAGAAADGGLSIARPVSATFALGWVGYVVFRDVYRSGHSTPDKLFGAGSVYVILGLVGGQLLEICDTLVPGLILFDLSAFPEGLHAGGGYLYLSFATLTTLGYGDVVPGGGPALIVAQVAAWGGPLFLTLTVARLTGLIGKTSASPEALPVEPIPPGNGWVATHRQVILFVSLAVLVSARPLLALTAARMMFVSLLLLAAAAMASVWAMAPRRGALRVGALLLLPTLALPVALYFGASEGLRLPSHVAQGAFFAWVGGQVFTDVFTARRVTPDKLFGAASAYLLLALVFSHLYAIAELIGGPGLSYTAERFPRGFEEMGGYLNFSLVTLMTVGYGDVLPVAPVTRALAVLEAMTGALVPATLIARVTSRIIGPGDEETR